LSGRGYGKRRVTDALRAAGVDESDSVEAGAHADNESVAAALRFAQRKRLGPFAAAAADRIQREKWVAAMVRAGHGFALARAIASLAPGAEIDLDQLSDRTRFADA
jgi:regulatory protein